MVTNGMSTNGMSIVRTLTRISKINDKSVHVFKYRNNGIKCTKKEIARIKMLGIPPNWTNVCISNSELSHLQATGLDDKKRTQYIYHPMWVLLTSVEKYKRIGEFSRRYRLLESKVNKDLTSDPTNEIPVMIKIIQKTYIRVGNDCYAKDNNTYGLSSLEKRHIKLNKGSINLSFVGKKGVPQSIDFRDPHCFQYLKTRLRSLKKNESVFGSNPAVLNNYLKNIMGSDFTCKDLRTYGGNVLFLKILGKLKLPTNQKEIKNNIKHTYLEVAKKLGHTVAISKKSYIVPVIQEQYTLNPRQFYDKNPRTILNRLCV